MSQNPIDDNSTGDRHQTIAYANVNPDLYRHMASLGHNKHWFCTHVGGEIDCITVTMMQHKNPKPLKE